MALRAARSPLPRRTTMFNKKTDETEWSRFSRALGGRESEREESAEAAPDNVAAPPQPPTAASRPAAQDTMVNVTRAPQPPIPRAVDDLDSDVESIIGEQSSFEGIFRAENSVRVRGRVQGELESKRSVFIEENAKVSAKVSGASIVVAGEVDGQLTCPGRVEIKPTGRVLGEIHAGTLIMLEGAFFEGQLKMVKTGDQAAAPAKSA
jgi:cytoskeletal protein CcmA (bactofilin family)